MPYFFKKSSSLLPGIDQTNQVCSNVVMMTKEGSNKIVNFMTPGAGVLNCARAWSYSENAFFL